MPTYSTDPLHPDRLRCDRCGLHLDSVSPVGPCDLGPLTALQVREYYPEAGDEAEMHDALCRWAEEGSAI